MIKRPRSSRKFHATAPSPRFGPMKRRAALAGAILAVALSQSTAAAGPSARSHAPAAAAAPARAATAPAVVTPAWTTYHLDNARDGNDTTEGKVTGITSAWTSPTLDGSLYASPLVYGNSVFVATENNTLYALSTADGTVQWSAHATIPEDGGLLPCGNINPVGVTSTPVIDPAAAGGHGMLFMVGMTSEPHYRMWGIDLVTHAFTIFSIVDAGDIMVQGQRGALGISGGVVYIPFGGRDGDCFDPNSNPPNHPYYGIVEAVRETDGVPLYYFNAGSTQAAGIWAPGGEAIDGSGNVYAATGNGSGPGSESVFKLSPSLGVLNQWRASNAQFLDNNDIDVGSISPALVGGGDVFQNGKYGHSFLLDSSLNQLTSDPGLDNCGGLTSAASFGATAYASPFIYVPCANGLYAVLQSGSSISVSWRQLSSFAGPPIVAGGVVWTMSGGNLYGFNASTGAPIANASIGSFSRFESPAAAGGKIFVPGDTFVDAFNLVLGCSTATLTAAPPTSQVAGGTVMFSATAAGPNCSTPTFEYWLQYPSGTWVLKRPFSSTSTWNWDTTGYPIGKYTVHVWANQSGDPTSTWEAFATLDYTLTGCTGAGLGASPGSPQSRGTQVQFTATSSGCANPQYEFWLQNPSGTWVMKQPFSPTATWTWDTTAYPTGTYTVHAWANQTGADMSTWQSFAEVIYALSVPPACATASVAPVNPSAPAGSTVGLTASSTGCPNPQYEFWVQYPNGSWYLKQGFGGATFNWNTAGLAPGTYTAHAWANQAGDSTSTWEAYGADTVTLTGCTSASLAPASPGGAAGSTVALTASSSGCPNPQYEFWVQYLDGSWHLLQGWGGAAFNWTTTGLAPGAYTVHVWANQQGAASSTWETFGSTVVNLTGCASASLSPSSGSSAVGATVVFTASSSGCPNPVYELWLQYPDGSWHLMRGFSTSNMWSWNTAGFPKGSYTVHVWANNQGAATNTWESYGSATYSLT
jgi:hypothetical protein